MTGAVAPAASAPVASAPVPSADAASAEGTLFAGRVALISGAAQGIGAATARGFVAGGGRAVLADCNGPGVAALAAELGPAAVAVTLDVTDEAGWAGAVGEAVARFGRLTDLFNVAGISAAGDIEAADPAHWARIMAVNLTGPYLGCRAALPALVASGSADCSIVTVGSMLALRPTAGFAAYSAAKAGVTALTRSVALHCAAKSYPVRVNAVHPGGTHTPMVDAVLDGMSGDRAANARRFAAKLPLGRLGLAEEVAAAILFLASPAAGFITAIDLPVDGGGSNRE
ncbi:MAG: SDR family oxidoreductase [Sphingomonadales bacterium]|nr:SDR family oxidoreductase [Sphingomonadales bacterium]